MQVKEKKRENIPYLLEKLENKKKDMITGLTRVIGTKFTHALELHRILGIPISKSNKIHKLTKNQKKNYVDTLNQLNFKYLNKDRQEVTKRTALMNIKCYRHWRFKNGLPCRGQRTKTNASTAQQSKKGVNINILQKKKFTTRKAFKKVKGKKKYNDKRSKKRK